MAPSITISENCYGMLKRLVNEPFEDTPQSIIHDLATAELARRAAQNGHGGGGSAPETVMLLDPDHPEDLTHTKVLAVELDGKPVHPPRWNVLRNAVHTLAVKNLGSFEAMQAKTSAHVREGKVEGEGYKYQPDGDFSIQQHQASVCWEQALHMAKVLGVGVKVSFVWRDKEGSSHPGKKGSVEWSPKKK
ncbi:MAG: T4SS efffector SepA family protein [Phycisphaerales bacterium]